MHKLKHSSILKSKHSFLFSNIKSVYSGAMLNIDNNDEQQRLELASRLKEAIASLPRGGKVRIAEACDISPTAITGWIKNGRIDKTNIAIVANMTSYDLNWLISGKGSKHITDSPQPSILDNNIAVGPENRGDVPVISWVQAGAWCEAIDNFNVGDAERWIPCPVSHSKHTYALRVRGDSMLAPFGSSVSFSEGTLIYVDPEAPLLSGKKVIAKLLDSNEVTFKVYREEDGKKWLFPLNPQYDKIELVEGMHICGVVIFAGFYV